MPYRNSATAAMLVLAASGSHAAFIKVMSGKDCAASGETPLTAEECQAEALGEGMSFQLQVQPGSLSIPPGCSWKSNINKIFYNPATTTLKECAGGTHAFACACKGSETTTTTDAPTTTTTTTAAPEDPASEHDEKQNEYNGALDEDSKLAALQAKCDACKTAEDDLITLLKRAVTEHGDAQKKKDLMDAAEKAMNEAKAAFETAKAAYDTPKTTAETTDGDIETATKTRDDKCGASVE